MKRIVSFTMFLCLMVCAGIHAQTDPHFTHFREVENFYNPAAMNRDSRLNVVGSLAMQMRGYTNAPVSMYIGGNMALPFGKQRNAVGMGLFNETMGLFTNRRLFFNYSYKIGVGSGWMNLGVQGGVMSEEFNGGSLKVEQQNDPAFPTGQERGTVGDLGAGVLYVGRSVGPAPELSACGVWQESGQNGLYGHRTDVIFDRWMQYSSQKSVIIGTAMHSHAERCGFSQDRPVGQGYLSV